MTYAPRKNQPNGYPTPHGRRRINADLDVEDFEQLRATALKNNMSIAEQIRTYITWGLEIDNG